MIGINVSKSSTSNLGKKVSKAVRRGMQDAADAGFAVSQDEVPRGATSGLSMSGVDPTWVGDTLVWGYTADYAKDVEEGRGPHLADFDDIRLWARRVLGDESAAGAVWRGIAEHGTHEQPYVEPGYDEQVRVLREQGLTPYLEDEL